MATNKMKKNKLELKLNKGLYTKKSVKAATADFKHLADFDLTDTKSYFIVKITLLEDMEVALFADEFLNYVLYAMKVK